MRDSLNRVKTLTARNIKEIMRDPISLTFMLALPLFMEILFYSIFHSMTSQFEMKYLAPGIVVFSQAFLSLFTGQLIALDRSSAFLTRLFVSRAKSREFIFGYALSLIPVTCIQSVLFFVVGGIIEPSIFGVNMIFAVLVSVFTSLLFIALGILFGSICNEKSIGGIASVVIMCQSLLSGMWFPVDGMGKTVTTLMKCLPFKNATDLAQNVLGGINDPLADFWRPALIVAGYTAVAFVTAILCFKAKMKEK